MPEVLSCCGLGFDAVEGFEGIAVLAHQDDSLDHFVASFMPTIPRRGANPTDTSANSRTRIGVAVAGVQRDVSDVVQSVWMNPTPRTSKACSPTSR